MVTNRGSNLARGIRQKVEALKLVCAEVDEDLASRAPKDRWSPKEILSHLSGPEGKGHLPILQSFLESEPRTISLDAGNPFFTAHRASMTFKELVAECERNYDRVTRFAEGLSDEQLDSKAHIPELKDSPLGEYPTLEAMIQGLGEYHIQFHVDHLGEILAELKR
ncbi:ClbS/DfsB family four-helix bundle protein [Geomonas sp. Red32]|uniref:ClbS/DfsB family four-helix bundle protein n=1 Tax=Geomonas sp. Red32 TaxID=2912856 RepID=UPI00202CB397|nr:ClbS/DfsB family four-helix bundle protein [Geomonas sp. Red32]MCM0080567.1 ClbS/DfsB family four-helix bundle protein [Geomonas sp. Red32]